MALGNPNKHKLLVHEGDRNVCGYGSKTFISSVNLWRHQVLEFCKYFYYQHKNVF